MVLDNPGELSVNVIRVAEGALVEEVPEAPALLLLRASAALLTVLTALLFPDAEDLQQSQVVARRVRKASPRLRCLLPLLLLSIFIDILEKLLFGFYFEW